MLQRVSSAVQEYYQLRMNKIHKFKPKVTIQMEVGPFILKTVTSLEELREALNLRWEVFHREMLGKNRQGIDVDTYDFVCDHLIIQEKKTGKIVGTYRLNCTLFSNEFYSANEFNLQKILAQPGVKIELGRACIHKDYRRGLVISLLWRGIAEYMAATGADMLFGCASVPTENPREAALIYRYFYDEGRLNPDYFSPPTIPFTMPSLDLWIQSWRAPLTEVEKAEAEKLLPPLCRAYIKIGANIGGEPAWDRDYKCIDFLTILHREDLNRSLWKKYKLEPESAGESASSSTT